MKKFKQYNESLRDKMLPKSKEELDEKYNFLIKSIMDKKSRDDIIDNYVAKVYGDFDHFEELRVDLLDDIVRDIDKKEFEKILKKQLKYQIYGT